MYNVMRGQAGNRIIITRKDKGAPYTTTTHYKSIEEFFTHSNKYSWDWYRIAGQPKVLWTTPEAPKPEQIDLFKGAEK